MKASDYIVEYLINKGITDVFGYPGGMVTHLMDSFSKYRDKIAAHTSYNEQGAAIAACGYAQVSGLTGVAYATSGPGATNMITGICNAYMDSIPTLYITGQVNLFEQKDKLKVRQRGFQETDIVTMVGSVTKYAACVNDAKELRYYLEHAFYMANEGRKGPVLLDIAMNVMRTEIDPLTLNEYRILSKDDKVLTSEDALKISIELGKAKKPVIIIGRGLTLDKELAHRLNNMGIPVVSSMIAVDVKASLENYYGFIGAYGDRTANFIVAKSNLVLSLGARLDVRQVGVKRDNFAPNSKIIRIDIDKNELAYKVNDDEESYVSDAKAGLKKILDNLGSLELLSWKTTCDEIKNRLEGYDNRKPNFLVNSIGKLVNNDAVITTDVGQNQVWVAQSFPLKENQRILFSGGHGAMGYSLPAAIGAYYGTRKPVVSFNGDGGLQMNIQEMQWISRERLPIKVVVFNNNALGMIRHFQEMYFNDNYFQTTAEGGYTSPDFKRIAEAYGFEFCRIESENEVANAQKVLNSDGPSLIEVNINENTYVFPKLEFGKLNQDQEPLIDRKLFDELMKLGEN